MSQVDGGAPDRDAVAGLNGSCAVACGLSSGMAGPECGDLDVVPSGVACVAGEDGSALIAGRSGRRGLVGGPRLAGKAVSKNAAMAGRPELSTARAGHSGGTKDRERRDARIIMGIDPGTNTAGYGVIEVAGSRIRCVVLGNIELHKLGDPYRKLHHLFERVAALVDEYRPDEVALESPFFGKNVQSMLKLGRAQGVAMAAALSRGVDVFEYAPRKIKQSITGLGAASKEQVAGLLKGMLGIEYVPKKLDATDGLAVAVCHYFETSTPAALMARAGSASVTGGGRGSRCGSWESFVSQNPERVKGKK